VEIGIALIVVAAVLVVVGLMLQRARPEEQASKPPSVRPGPASPADVDLDHPRPPLAGFHVDGEIARVEFDVPLPEDDDPMLNEFLLDAGMHVAREKMSVLPMSQVRRIVVVAGSGAERREIGSTDLPEPGRLPPARPPILGLGGVAKDPFETAFSSGGSDEDFTLGIPSTVGDGKPDVLPPLSAELNLPRAVEIGLRAQGLDPDDLDAGSLIKGVMRLFGYQVAETADPHRFTASKAGIRTLVRHDPYSPGDHPEVDEQRLRGFLAEFESSGLDRGLFVSEKFGPFVMYDLERREPRVRFATRERLQKLLDVLSLS